MTEPEQWAVELWRKACHDYGGASIADTPAEWRAVMAIQRAFEERERELRERLEDALLFAPDNYIPPPRKEAAMISEQMKAEGWIEHDGGPCPVNTASTIYVMLGNGTTGWVMPCNTRWEYPPDNFLDGRIVAYKPEGHPNDQ